jgi:Phosphotransferase enzyme family
VMSECILKDQGYSCKVEVRHPYKGNRAYSTVIRASKDRIHYLLFQVPFWRVGHYRRIVQNQHQLKMVPKLVHFAESIFLIEKCEGTLVWETDDNAQFCDQLPSALAQFVSSLGRVGLVHGDIRPWNIFYDRNNKEFKIIDWGFSFFLGEDLSKEPLWHLRDHLQARGHDLAKPHQVDHTDALKTEQIVKGTLRLEDAWLHQADDIEWRPSWAAR